MNTEKTDWTRVLSYKGETIRDKNQKNSKLSIVMICSAISIATLAVIRETYNQTHSLTEQVDQPEVHSEFQPDIIEDIFNNLKFTGETLDQPSIDLLTSSGFRLINNTGTDYYFENSEMISISISKDTITAFFKRVNFLTLRRSESERYVITHRTEIN